MIIIGGKPDMIPLAVRPVWFHRRNYKNGASPVRPLTKRSKSKASAWNLWIHLALSLCLHHLHSDRNFQYMWLFIKENVHIFISVVFIACFVCLLCFLVTLHVPLITFYDQDDKTNNFHVCLLFLRHTFVFHIENRCRPIATITSHKWSILE